MYELFNGSGLWDLETMRMKKFWRNFQNSQHTGTRFFFEISIKAEIKAEIQIQIIYW